MKTALYDADFLLYRIGHGMKHQNLDLACSVMDEYINRSLEPVDADVTVFFLSDPAGNFRHALYPEYKANRTAPKPDHYDGLWDYLVDSWTADIAVYMEADDALSLDNINSKTHKTILISQDKDLMQVPGHHYNPVTGVFRNVGKFASLYNLYYQVLIGDTVDNIKGIPGVGPVTAAKILLGCQTEEQMFEAVRKAYNDDEALVLNMQLVWLLSKDRTNLVFERIKSNASEQPKESATVDGGCVDANYRVCEPVEQPVSESVGGDERGGVGDVQ